MTELISIKMIKFSELVKFVKLTILIMQIVSWLPNCPKIKKVRDTPLSIYWNFYILYGVVGRTKGLRNHRSWARNLIFYTGNFTKNLCIFEKKFWTFGPNIFRDSTLIKSNKSTGSGFEFQHQLCSLSFYTKTYTKIILFRA